MFFITLHSIRVVSHSFIPTWLNHFWGRISEGQQFQVLYRFLPFIVTRIKILRRKGWTSDFSPIFPSNPEDFEQEAATIRRSTGHKMGFPLDGIGKSTMSLRTFFWSLNPKPFGNRNKSSPRIWTSNGRRTWWWECVKQRRIGVYYC